jgi:hypothetical protein
MELQAQTVTAPKSRKICDISFLVTIRTTCEKLAINFTHENKNSRNATQVPQGRFNNGELALLRLNFLTSLYKNSVRTSQETRYVSATEPNRLMLFREELAVRTIWNTTTHSVGRM